MDENPYNAPDKASDRESLAAREDEAELRISPVIALGGLAALALLSPGLLWLPWQIANAIRRVLDAKSLRLLAVCRRASGQHAGYFTGTSLGTRLVNHTVKVPLPPSNCAVAEHPA